MCFHRVVYRCIWKLAYDCGAHWPVHLCGPQTRTWLWRMWLHNSSQSQESTDVYGSLWERWLLLCVQSLALFMCTLMDEQTQESVRVYWSLCERWLFVCFDTPKPTFVCINVCSFVFALSHAFEHSQMCMPFVKDGFWETGEGGIEISPPPLHRWPL